MVNLLEKRRRLIISTSNRKQILEAFRTHEKVLLHISNKPSDAYIIEKKRDTLTVVISWFVLINCIIGWSQSRTAIDFIVNLEFYCHINRNLHSYST